MKAKYLDFCRFTFLQVCFLLISFGAYSQIKESDYLRMDYAGSMMFVPGNEKISPFFISEKPVTNREYILYLVWSEIVFTDYPETVYRALPGLSNSETAMDNFRPLLDSASFKFYMDHSAPFVRDYMFNPFYLDYPVIGLDWEQANTFSHWLSDRYNEYYVIKKGVLKFDEAQVDERNFTTESFMFRQYEGIVNHPLSSFYSDELARNYKEFNYWMRPSFHLATRSELAESSVISKNNTARRPDSRFRSFPAEMSAFLKPFYDYYLPEKKGLVSPCPGQLIENQRMDLKPMGMTSFSLPGTCKEWTLDSYISKDALDLPAIFSCYGYRIEGIAKDWRSDTTGVARQKDFLGRMSVILTGINKQGEFELAEAPVSLQDAKKTDAAYVWDPVNGKVLNQSGEHFLAFRVAVSAVKKPIK